MRTTSVSELKAHLSKYLREVRRGGEVQILDRGVPVARLVGLRPADAELDARRDRLVRAGVLRPGTGDVSVIREQPPIRLGADADISGALRGDREDRV